jgi:hypothetical protein
MCIGGKIITDEGEFGKSDNENNDKMTLTKIKERRKSNL